MLNSIQFSFFYSICKKKKKGEYYYSVNTLGAAIFVSLIQNHDRISPYQFYQNKKSENLLVHWKSRRRLWCSVRFCNALAR